MSKDQDYKIVRQKLKIGKIILACIALLIVGGFAYLLLADVPVTQVNVSKEIPHDRFSQ